MIPKEWVALYQIGLAEQEMECAFQNSQAFIPEITFVHLQVTLPEYRKIK